jgi:hypothetical protein
MNTRVKILGFLVVSFFAILLLVTSFTQKNQIVYKGEAMLEVVNKSNYLLDSTELAKIPLYLLIDLRSVEKAILHPVQGAINIPVAELLAKEQESIFQREGVKVFLSNDLQHANQAWMLMTQLGYQDIYVLDRSIK